MNKTVSINISGIIFNIDEEAYEKLSIYLETIRGYFKDSEGREEIMADIEARVAEILQEKISEKKQVISMEDVDEVIALMGQPEAFFDEEAAEQASEQEKSEEFTGTGRKRLYRDTDNKIIGGVCSGIGHYFGFDPVWLRLAFVLAFLFYGTGFWLYIILWIIIPEAKTVAEKLEMKGKRVTVKNISKAIEDEMEHLKKRFNNLTDEAKKFDSDRYRTKAQGVLDKIVDFVVDLFRLLFKAVGKVLGILLIIAGVLLAIVLIGLLFGSSDSEIHTFTMDGMKTFSLANLIEVIFQSSEQAMLAIIGLALLAGIPVFAVIYGGIKLLFSIKGEPKGFGIILTSFWILGLILTGAVGLQIANEFSQKAKAEHHLEIMEPAGDTLAIAVGNDVFLSHRTTHRSDRIMFFKLENDTILMGYPKLDIRKSQTDSFQVIMKSSSRGTTQKMAYNRAAEIVYQYKQFNSTLELASWFATHKDNKWRNQELQLLVLVPEGKAVHLETGTDRMLYDVANVTNTHDRKMDGKVWTMLEDGLTCVDCDPEEL